MPFAVRRAPWASTRASAPSWCSTRFMPQCCRSPKWSTQRCCEMLDSEMIDYLFTEKSFFGWVGHSKKCVLVWIDNCRYARFSLPLPVIGQSTSIRCFIKHWLSHWLHDTFMQISQYALILALDFNYSHGDPQPSAILRHRRQNMYDIYKTLTFVIMLPYCFRQWSLGFIMWLFFGNIGWSPVPSSLCH